MHKGELVHVKVEGLKRIKKGDNDDLHHTYKVIMRLIPGSTDETERGEVELFVKPSQVEKRI